MKYYKRTEPDTTVAQVPWIGNGPIGRYRVCCRVEMELGIRHDMGATRTERKRGLVGPENLLAVNLSGAGFFSGSTAERLERGTCLWPLRISLHTHGEAVANSLHLA